MAVKIFIWVGHPRGTSLSQGLAEAYARGAEAAGAQIRHQQLSTMVFDPDLEEGYHARKALEPCLNTWRDNIQWATHLCWAYPVWWGGMPAKTKGVIDRAFLPGFAMRYHENDPWWDRLLAGRSADLLLTSDAPVWFDHMTYGRPAKNQAGNAILKFAGIKPVRTLQVGPVKTASKKTIARWLRQAETRGRRTAGQASVS